MASDSATGTTPDGSSEHLLVSCAAPRRGGPFFLLGPGWMDGTGTLFTDICAAAWSCYPEAQSGRLTAGRWDGPPGMKGTWRGWLLHPRRGGGGSRRGRGRGAEETRRGVLWSFFSLVVLLRMAACSPSGPAWTLAVAVSTFRCCLFRGLPGWWCERHCLAEECPAKAVRVRTEQGPPVYLQRYGKARGRAASSTAA
jgi:hypothetical protein